MMRLCICTAVYNADGIVDFVIESILSQRLPSGVDVIPIVIDSGSSDGSPERALKIYRDRGFNPVYHKERLNVSQARNRCIDIARELNCDLLLILDHDVVALNDRLLALGITLTKMLEGKFVIAIPYRFTAFKSLDELREFVGTHRNEDRCFKASPRSWTVSGFMFLPRQTLEHLRFLEDMNFRDDTLFGFNAWLKGFGIYVVNGVSSKPLAIDVSIGSKMDLYARLPIREYLKSMRKKVLSDVYFYSTISEKLSRRIAFCARIIAKYIATSCWIPSIVLGIVLISLGYSVCGLVLSILSASIAVFGFLRELVKVKSVHLAARNLVKFSLFALASLALLPIIAIRYRSNIKKVVKALREFEEVMVCVN